MNCSSLLKSTCEGKPLIEVLHAKGFLLVPAFAAVLADTAPMEKSSRMEWKFRDWAALANAVQGFQAVVETPNYFHLFAKQHDRSEQHPHRNSVIDFYRDDSAGVGGRTTVNWPDNGADGFFNIAAAQSWSGVHVFWQVYLRPYGGDPGRFYLQSARLTDSNHGWVIRSVLDGRDPDTGRRIDADVGDAVVALGSADAIHVFYTSTAGIRHAWWFHRDISPADPSRFWRYETVESGTSRYRPAAVHRAGGGVSLLWRDKHGFLAPPDTSNWYPVPGTWKIEDFNPITSRPGEIPDSVAAVEWNGSLHIFYYSKNHPGIFHGVRDGSGWHHEPWLPEADSRAGIAAAAYGDAIHIFYGNRGNGTLEYSCYRLGQPANAQAVDGHLADWPRSILAYGAPPGDNLLPSAYVLGKEVGVVYALNRIGHGAQFVRQASFRPLPQVRIATFTAARHWLVFVPSVRFQLLSSAVFRVSVRLTVTAGSGPEQVVVTEDPYGLGGAVGDWEGRQMSSSGNVIVGFWLGRTSDGSRLVTNDLFTFKLVVSDANGQQVEAETAVEIQWHDSAIRCIVRARPGDPVRAIQAFGGRTRNGFTWQLTREQVISEIRKGEQFFVDAPSGDRVQVLIAQTEDGLEYVRTAGDGLEPNNLLSLPGCQQ